MKTSYSFLSTKSVVFLIKNSPIRARKTSIVQTAPQSGRFNVLEDTVTSCTASIHGSK